MAFTSTTGRNTFFDHNQQHIHIQSHNSLLMNGILVDPSFDESIFMALHNDPLGESPAKQPLKQQQPQQGGVVASGRQANQSLSSPSTKNYNTMTISKKNDHNNNNNSATKVYPAEWDHVTEVGDHDCLLGRGGGANKHSGNIKFRQLIKEYKFRYIEVPKIQKPKVAEEVVQVWRNMNPPGRFLARKNEQTESSTRDNSKSSSNETANKNNQKNDEKNKNGDAKNKKDKDDRLGALRLSLSDNHDDDDEEVWYDVGDKRARAKASMALRERTPDAVSFVKKLREEQDAQAKQGAILVQQQMHPSSSSSLVHHQQQQKLDRSTTTSPTASASGSSPTSPARSVVVPGIHNQQLLPSPHDPPSPPQFLPRRGSDATLCTELSDMHMTPHLHLQQQHLQQQQQQQQQYHHPLPHPGSLSNGGTPGGVRGRPAMHPSLSNPCFGGGAGGRPTLHPSHSTPCFPAQPHSPPPTPHSPESPRSTQSAPQQQDQRLQHLFPGPAEPASLLLHEQQQMQVRTMEEDLMRKQSELESLQQHILTMRRQRAEQQAERAQGQHQQLSTSPPQASDGTPTMEGGTLGEAANTMLFPVVMTSSTIGNDKTKNKTTARYDDDVDRRNMEMYRSLLENYFDRDQIQGEEVGSDLEDDDVDDWGHDFSARNRGMRRGNNAAGGGGGCGGDKSAHDTPGARGKVLSTNGYGLLSSSNAAHDLSLSQHHHRHTSRRTADSTTSGSFHGSLHHSGDRAPRRGVARNKSNMSMQSTCSARSDDDLMAMSIISSAELGYLSMDDHDDDEIHSLYSLYSE
jgi:hypothetical protein